MFFLGGAPALLSLFIRARVKESAAWHEHRVDWKTYRAGIWKHWPRFLYLVLLMTMMNFMSHGTQDMYPTFLQQARHFSPSDTASLTMITNVGAILGGLVFGFYSDRAGRRRAMITAALFAMLVVPLWLAAPNTALIAVGGFLIQFFVQGAGASFRRTSTSSRRRNTAGSSRGLRISSAPRSPPAFRRSRRGWVSISVTGRRWPAWP